jgi:hypothetical protein
VSSCLLFRGVPATQPKPPLFLRPALESRGHGGAVLVAAEPSDLPVPEREGVHPVGIDRLARAFDAKGVVPSTTTMSSSAKNFLGSNSPTSTAPPNASKNPATCSFPVRELAIMSRVKRAGAS